MARFVAGLGNAALGFLWDHCIRGRSLLPLAAFLEAGHTAGETLAIGATTPPHGQLLQIGLIRPMLLGRTATALGRFVHIALGIQGPKCWIFGSGWLSL